MLEAYQVSAECTFAPLLVTNIIDQTWEILGITGLDDVVVEMESSYHEFDPEVDGGGRVLPYFMGVSDQFWSAHPPPPPLRVDQEVASYFALPDWTVGISTADWPALVSAQFVPNISVDALLNYLEMSDYDKRRRALYEAQPGYMTGPEPERETEQVAWADGRQLQEFDHNSDPDPVYNPWEAPGHQFLNVSNCTGEQHYIVRLSIGTYNMTQRNEFVRIFDEQRLNATVCGDEFCTSCMERCSLEPSIFNSRRVFFAPAPPPDVGITEEVYSGIGLGVGIVGFSLVFIIAGLGQRCFAPPKPKCDAPPTSGGMLNWLPIPAAWLVPRTDDKHVLHLRGDRVCEDDDRPEGLPNDKQRLL